VMWFLFYWADGWADGWASSIAPSPKQTHTVDTQYRELSGHVLQFLLYILKGRVLNKGHGINCGAIMLLGTTLGTHRE
jgi:hypothetical protein